MVNSLYYPIRSKKKGNYKETLAAKVTEEETTFHVDTFYMMKQNKELFLYSLELVDMEEINKFLEGK